MMWIDKEKKKDGFDGVLLVVNHQDNDTPDKLEALVDAVAYAHADGHAVFYVFDDIEAVKPPPDEVEWRDDMDFLRPLKGQGVEEFMKAVMDEIKPRFSEEKHVFSNGVRKTVS